MTKPLALVFYETLLPGSQLINRLQDLGYRVIAFHDSYLLEDQSEREKPLVVIADVSSPKSDVCGAIKKLRENPTTRHIPILAFALAGSEEIMAKAREAGANLVADAAGISEQLPQLLEAVLQIE